MASVSVNWLAVIVTAVISMAVGAAWYSPLLFSKRWMSIMAKDRGEPVTMGEGVAKLYIINFVGAFLLAYILARFVGYRGAASLGQGALTGIMAWVGFVITTSLGGILFERRPFGLYAINNAFHFVTMAIGGAVLAVWR